MAVCRGLGARSSAGGARMHGRMKPFEDMARWIGRASVRRQRCYRASGRCRRGPVEPQAATQVSGAPRPVSQSRPALSSSSCWIERSTTHRTSATPNSRQSAQHSPDRSCKAARRQTDFAVRATSRAAISAMSALVDGQTTCRARRVARSGPGRAHLEPPAGLGDEQATRCGRSRWNRNSCLDGMTYPPCRAARGSP